MDKQITTKYIKKMGNGFDFNQLCKILEKQIEIYLKEAEKDLDVKIINYEYSTNKLTFQTEIVFK